MPLTGDGVSPVGLQNERRLRCGEDCHQSNPAGAVFVLTAFAIPRFARAEIALRSITTLDHARVAAAPETRRSGDGTAGVAKRGRHCFSSRGFTSFPPTASSPFSRLGKRRFLAHVRADDTPQRPGVPARPRQLGGQKKGDEYRGSTAHRPFGEQTETQQEGEIAGRRDFDDRACGAHGDPPAREETAAKRRASGVQDVRGMTGGASEEDA
jgi:hypothetical protein